MTAIRIPLARPLFGPEEERAVVEVLRGGWVMQGPRVRELEERLAQSCGGTFAVACSSGTAALHLALWALGVGPGDEVLVPALTYVATAHAVELCGARPVFVDVDPRTWAPTTEAWMTRRSDRCAALVPVHLFGRPSEVAALGAAGLPVVEDAAGALGALDAIRGDAVVYSFHPRKLATMGEGGAIVTERADIAARCQSIRNQGRAASAAAESVDEYAGPGSNYRLTDLQAAIGLCQMDRLAHMRERRYALASRYRKLLAALSQIELPPSHPRHVYQAFVILVPDRDAVIAHLARAGIQAGPGSHAPPLLPYYREKYRLDPAEVPHAAAVHERSVALPLYPQMTEEEHDAVVGALAEILA